MFGVDFFWRGQGAVSRISWLRPGRHSHRAETSQSPALSVLKANNPLLGRPHPYTPRTPNKFLQKGILPGRGRGIQGAKLPKKASQRNSGREEGKRGTHLWLRCPAPTLRRTPP